MRITYGESAGPVQYLCDFVLGITVTEPGCKKIIIKPQLGNLEWARGTYPTPFGTVYVRHEILPDGTVKTQVKAPDEIEIIIKN